MDCKDCETLIDAYIDGELSMAETIAIEQALPQCPACARRLADAGALRSAFKRLPYHQAPPLLGARILRDIGIAPPRPRATGLAAAHVWRWAAAIIVALGIGWLAGRNLPLSGDGQQTQTVLAGYLRIAAADRPVEVASSDHHTVKPWFAGRIDFSPPVHDLTGSGFPLLGGRVDLLDGKRVATLLYRRNQHTIALFIWPDPSARPFERSTRNGYEIVNWSRGGFAYWAISDLQGTELAAFATTLDGQLAADR